MSWRLDWMLLATGLISFGLTMVQKGRADVLRLLAGDSESGGGLLATGVGLFIPAALLLAFVARLIWRLLTRTWR